MSERPRVDVGVITYNTRDLSVQALRRLLDTDQGVDLRLLVRDNGSTDGTADAVASEVPEAVLDRGTNVGFSGGVNSLLARSDAPWFLALNSDAWPDPGAIATLVETAEAHPRAALVAPRLERPDGELEHSCHPFPSLGVAAVLATGTARFFSEDVLAGWALEGSFDHRTARAVDWAVGAAWLLRRSAIDEVGGLDERFFMYAEDLEWCWRATRAGWTIEFTPHARVVHVGNASGASAYGSRRTRAYWTNTYRCCRTVRGPLWTWAYRALNVAGSARAWAAARARGDRDLARYWSEHTRAHFGSTRGSDGPPA